RRPNGGAHRTPALHRPRTTRPGSPRYAGAGGGDGLCRGRDGILRRVDPARHGRAGTARRQAARLRGARPAHARCRARPGPPRRTAESFGRQRIVWHGWPRDDRYDSLDGIRRLAGDFNAAGANAAADGLTLGIHNHWWECDPVEGQVPYRVLLEELDPAIFV